MLSESLVMGVFVVALLSHTLIELWLNRRHQNHIVAHRGQVPVDFSSVVSLADHQKAADYSAAKLSLGRVQLVIDAILLVVMVMAGGFQAIYDWVTTQVALSEVWQQVVFLLSVFWIMSLVHLPLSWYATFRIEEQFGFNKMTMVKWLTDMVKGWALMLVLGVPLLWAMISIMTSFMQQAWWLYAWLLWMGFNLLLLWLYPIWIAPIFNRFTPLVDGEMKSVIEALLAKTGFSSKGIFVMDGSSRSGHGNAYFTGFGRNKRIVFFDTLLEKLTVPQVAAVLAHELGHFKHGHIKQRLLEGAVLSLMGLALLGWLVEQPAFFTGLGMTTATPAAALLLFMTVVPVLFFWLSPLMAMKSRQHEFEADAFAAEHASAQALIDALLAMYRDNASSLTPDAWYSAYHDSHPPAAIRIAHLKGLMGQVG